jgi:hypothetical protein
MSLTTSTTWTNLIQEVLLPRVQSVFFQNDSLFKIWAPQPHLIGDSIDWPIHYGPSTDYAGTYSEGDPAPNPNIDVILKGSVSKQPFQVSASISKVALDYMGGNKLGLSDPVLFDIENKVKALLNSVNVTLLASLEAAVDSTGTYGGNAIATYSALASYESAVSGVHSISMMEDMYEALLDNDRGCDPSQLICLMPQNQITNHTRLVSGASNYPLNHQSGSPTDGGRQIPGAKFNGVPIYGIPDMTDTVVLMGEKDKVAIFEARPVTIEEKSVTADEVFFLITCNYQIALLNQAKWAKLTGVTA